MHQLSRVASPFCSSHSCRRAAAPVHGAPTAGSPPQPCRKGAAAGCAARRSPPPARGITTCGGPGPDAGIVPSAGILDPPDIALGPSFRWPRSSALGALRNVTSGRAPALGATRGGASAGAPGPTKCSSCAEARWRARPRAVGWVASSAASMRRNAATAAAARESPPAAQKSVPGSILHKVGLSNMECLYDLNF